MICVRAATPEDQSSVVTLWIECDLIKPPNNPVDEFPLALATSTSTVLVLEMEWSRAAAGRSGRRLVRGARGSENNAHGSTFEF